ncbi:MAG: hypothetical protein PHD65_02085 [Gallionella sp.]|nr:hypothetical protein [Gallionella sp.]
MKNLILAITLMAIGIVLPIGASAKIDSATLERQRTINRAQLEKTKKLRAGQHERRIFKKSDAEIREGRSLKLDAIPPSPRRTTKTTSKSSKSTTKPEHSPEAAKAPKE